MVGFVKESLPRKKPLIKLDFRHSICFGETGSGKTSSFILPNIETRIKRDFGMFIIDYKGNLDSPIKLLAKKANKLSDVVELGSAWGDSINILNGVSKKLFLEVLEILDGDEEQNKDKFWITSALNIVDIIYESLSLIQHLRNLSTDMYTTSITHNHKYNIDIQSFTTITRDTESLEEFYNYAFLYMDEFDIDYIKINRYDIDEKTAQLIYNFKNILQTKLQNLKIFTNSIDPERPASGGGGVLLVIRNLILTLNTKSLNGVDDILELLNQGKIVVFKSGTFNNTTTKAILHILYTRLAQREVGLTPVSLFIDEFQRSVTQKTLPFIDVFREKKVELICAMQNSQQLENLIGENKSIDFLSNIIHQYHYANRYEHKLEMFEYVYNGKKFRAIPMFLKKDVLNRVQYLWQQAKKIEIELEGEWIYKKTIDNYTSTIFNISTSEERTYYPLHKREDSITKFYKEMVTL